MKPTPIVMLVEANAALRGAVGELLRDEGYEVASVASSRLALAQIGAGVRPSVVVIDRDTTGAWPHETLPCPSEGMALVVCAFEPYRVRERASAVVSTLESDALVAAVNELAPLR